jgi:hypothetical protein
MEITPSEKWGKRVQGSVKTIVSTVTEEDGKSYPFRSGNFDFIDIVKDPTGETQYVCNQWVERGVVLFIPEKMVAEVTYYPVV